MSNTLSIVKPKTFAELLAEIESFQKTTSASWYRGTSDETYLLKPSLFRHPTKTAIQDVGNLEIELTTRFVQRSLPFLNRSLTNDWDKLFLMQHYGVPTRLLDWTENPFVAIYFALVSSTSNKKSDACVWMCDPIAWNRSVLDHISFKGGILDESSDLINNYSLGRAVDQMPMHPIMMYGTYNSPRIVAQRGGFALFGQGLEPMEESYLSDKFKKDTLKKIVIEQARLKDIKASLLRKGFSESVVFPDLEGLARELKRTFEFAT